MLKDDVVKLYSVRKPFVEKKKNNKNIEISKKTENTWILTEIRMLLFVTWLYERCVINAQPLICWVQDGNNNIPSRGVFITKNCVIFLTGFFQQNVD